MKPAGFSPKQLTAMGWWLPGSRYRDREAIICDGAVRSGKTLSMSLGFFLWAMSCFSGRQFALCGKTAPALRRNVVTPILPWLTGLKMQWQEKRGDNVLIVRWGGRENRFYWFGGYDEASAARIQGSTFGGVLMDEVALMPRSFVEQAMARCSLEGSRLWFNCNPEGPGHWFYRQWICQAEKRRCLYLHFTMEDNPSLSPAIRSRYRRLYTGTFYDRYILGRWTAAEGRVYDFFTEEMAKPVPEGPFESWCVSCDYGTVNPASFGLWGLKEGVWYRTEEFYFDSRKRQFQMTDREYAEALRTLTAGRPVEAVVVDPSAASFIALLRQEGWPVIPADNDVLGGIRRTSDALKTGRIVLCQTCRDCLREIQEYVWDLGKGDRDRVKKENDHAMDDMRYFVSTVLDGDRGGFAATTALRTR